MVLARTRAVLVAVGPVAAELVACGAVAGAPFAERLAPRRAGRNARSAARVGLRIFAVFVGRPLGVGEVRAFGFGLFAGRCQRHADDDAARHVRQIAGAEGHAAEHAAGPRGRARNRVEGREILRNALALFLVGGVEQPQQQEERHHRGHEVGIRNFPAAAMGRVVALLDALDDDDWMIAFVGHYCPVCGSAHEYAPMRADLQGGPGCTLFA